MFLAKTYGVTGNLQDPSAAAHRQRDGRAARDAACRPTTSAAHPPGERNARQTSGATRGVASAAATAFGERDARAARLPPHGGTHPPAAAAGQRVQGGTRRALRRHQTAQADELQHPELGRLPLGVRATQTAAAIAALAAPGSAPDPVPHATFAQPPSSETGLPQDG